MHNIIPGKPNETQFTPLGSSSRNLIFNSRYSIRSNMVFSRADNCSIEKRPNQGLSRP